MNRKQRTVIAGMAGNFFLAAAKTLLSLISGSAALLADALHSFSDLLVSLLVLAGLRFNRKRIEAIVSLIVGFFILSVAAGFAVELFFREPVEIKKVAWAVSGQIIIIITTYILYKYKTVIGKEENSESLIADGSHTKSDMLSSIGVLVSLVGTLIGLNLDRIAAFIIFFLILYQGLETISGAIIILRGKNESSPFLYNFPFEKKAAQKFKELKIYINKNRKKPLIYFAIIFFIAYFIPGFYIIDESEQGVRTVAGIVEREIIEPGLHLDPLFFISKIDKFKTDKIKTLEYGFRKRDISADDVLINQWETVHNSKKYSADENEEDLLTGDGSIININLIVEYRISDPVSYLIYAEDPLSILRIETGSQLQKISGSMPLFSALNKGRSYIEQELKIRLNRSLNQIKTGLTVEDIYLFSVHPHLETAYIFRFVQNEEQHKDTLLYDAEAVKEKQLPYYRGLAYEKIVEAEAQAKAIVLEAESDAVIYKVLEREYLENKEALTFRLLLENRNKILKNSEKIIIDKSLKDNLIRIGQGRE